LHKLNIADRIDRFCMLNTILTMHNKQIAVKNSPIVVFFRRKCFVFSLYYPKFAT